MSKVRIEYLKDVHQPDCMVGKKGDVREIERWWAEVLTEGGLPYARYCDDPKTGEPIIYPPEPEPEMASAESALAAHGEQSPTVHVTETKDLTHGIAEQAAGQGVKAAPHREGSDPGVG